MSGFTAFKTSKNLGSSWPAGIQYNSGEAKYVFSVNNTFQISALSHFHVIDIDLPQVGPNPNVMTLTLPIQSNLPLQSRIYFFYVTNSNDGDELRFEPVSLSGNTINGNALGFTFLLSGRPELLMCIGVNSNYVIQAFARNNTPSSPLIPTVAFNLNINPPNGPYFLPSFNPILSNCIDMLPGNLAFLNEVEINPGMSGYLRNNTPIPTQPFDGFLCTQSGVYLFDPQINGKITYVASPTATSRGLGPVQANILEFDNTGTPINPPGAPSSCYIPLIATTNPTPYDINWQYTTSQFVTLTAGHYYTISLTYDDSTSGSASSPFIQGALVFCYWSPNIIASTSSSISSSFISQQPSLRSFDLELNESEDHYAPLSNPISGDKAITIQRQVANRRASSLNRFSSQLSSEDMMNSNRMPSFTLLDMERMIQQALDSRNPVPLSESSSSQSTSYSSSSMSKTLEKEPVTKKRKQMSSQKR